MQEYILIGSIGIVGLALLIQKQSYSRRFPNIPSVGPHGFFSSWKSAWDHFIRSRELILEGYHKHKIFNYPSFIEWRTVLSDVKLIDEMRKAPDNELSFPEAVNEILGTEYTLGPAIHHNAYHIEIIRNQLTKSLPLVFGDLVDELQCAFKEIIPATDEWSRINATPSIMKLVARSSNRTFVGLPLCRNPEWIQLNIDYTIEVVKGSFVINIAPHFLKPLVGRYLTTVPKANRRGLTLIGPMIEERRKSIEGDQKPNDILQWILDSAGGQAESTQEITTRILAVNFAAIHTTSMSFTHALYDIAAHPEWVDEMRAEVEEVIAREGWTKIGMNKMRKLDSFLKESQRVNGLGTTSLQRKVLKPEGYTFSDGTHVPCGVTISAASGGLHRDERVYEKPEEFMPFRFAEMRDEEGEGSKHQMVATSNEYLPFGHGRHACPGRFFAVNELKAMMSYVLLNYDVKTIDGQRPKNSYFGTAVVPHTTAELLIRKRK
ncbi:hypothetical protein PROFUN_03137 [Planoprotostelium fungivorum]|uniref:Cytochrome P450 n=1 Tax=Planoprotostelium fungivorum TaxID=1890364 RepID=A0A2P6NQB9_9EUKA|nr:hypothetical protein PROFUN_03137 [Planoprotostelium fungivorum]